MKDLERKLSEISSDLVKANTKIDSKEEEIRKLRQTTTTITSSSSTIEVTNLKTEVTQYKRKYDDQVRLMTSLESSEKS